MKKQKILCCMRHGFPPAGGAETSMLILSKRLSKDYDVEIYSLGRENFKGVENDIAYTSFNFYDRIPPVEKPLKESIKIREIKNDKNLEKAILESNPDIIISQHELSFLVSKMLRKKTLSVPLFNFIHEFGYTDTPANICIGKDSKEYERSRYLHSKNNTLELQKVISSSKRTFVPSLFLNNHYKFLGFNNLKVCNPFINLEEFFNQRGKGNRNEILHVKPVDYKGIFTTLELARKLPKERFTICGSGITRDVVKIVDELENVKYIGECNDMPNLYSRCKLVLLPSKRPETFGIVSIEAQASGCNNLASNIGGVVAPKPALISPSLEGWLEKVIEGGSSLEIEQLKKYDVSSNYGHIKKVMEM
ncbi:MAG: glycosyltransferase family 4 protein [Nanoarchaeota archaeon]|nr:glycosyltransferase family 4 protein [Nanoarchaeota archaeon]